MRFKRYWLLAGLLTICSPNFSNEPIAKPYRIALGSFGKEDYAEYYRLLLEEELINKEVNVVSTTDQPDAILSGIVIRFDPPNHRGPGPVGAAGVLRLALPNGRVIWRGTPWRDYNYSAPSQIDLLAGELTKAIRLGAIFRDQKN